MIGNYLNTLTRDQLHLMSDQQAFLIFLRTFSFEFSQKRQSFEWLNRSIKLFKKLGNTELLEDTIELKNGVKYFLEHDAVFYFQQLWECLDNGRYDIFQSKWISVNHNLGISTSCCYTPVFGMPKRSDGSFYKREYQQLLTFNVIPENNSTNIIMSWFSEHNNIANWINGEVSTNTGLQSFLNTMAFAESEDTCFSPALWESFSHEMREEIVSAMSYRPSGVGLTKIPNVVQIKNA